LGGQLKDVIEGVLLVREHTITLQAADEGRRLEEALGVLEVQGQKGSGGLKK
jgi:hypothetical protein